MLSTDYPGGGGPTGAGSQAGPAGPCAPHPAGTHPGRPPRSPSPSGSGSRGAKGNPPPVFDVSGRGAFGAGAAGRLRDQLKKRGVKGAPGRARCVPPEGGRAVPAGRAPQSYFFFWGGGGGVWGQRRKNNRKSDRVRVASGFAACAFQGKIRKPFLPSKRRGGGSVCVCEGLKPHGRTASTGEAESGAQPGPRSPPVVQPLLPPQSRAGPPRTPPNPPAPFTAQRGGEGRAVRRGQLSQSQSFVICLPEQQKSNR